MNNPFKTGDKVVAIGECGGDLRIGKVYTVKAISGKLVTIEGRYENGDPPICGQGYNNFRAAIAGQDYEVPQQPAMILATDAAERKATPITTGVLDYFPRALAAVAQCSKAGNDQHNPGQPLHWAKGKSTDHADCIARHLIDRKSLDTDGIPHRSKLAWRALALLETELEAEEQRRANAA